LPTLPLDDDEELDELVDEVDDELVLEVLDEVDELPLPPGHVEPPGSHPVPQLTVVQW
jgi:hypothetical protein